MQNTQRVVDYIVASRFEDIPAKARTVAKGAMLDCLGVALAGARHPAEEISPAKRKSAGPGKACPLPSGSRFLVRRISGAGHAVRREALVAPLNMQLVKETHDASHGHGQSQCGL